MNKTRNEGSWTVPMAIRLGQEKATKLHGRRYMNQDYARLQTGRGYAPVDAPRDSTRHATS